MQSILIIDDDDVDFLITKKFITKIKNDTHCIHKNDVETAIDFIKEVVETNNPLPDIILIDINMPGLDGFNFLELLNEFPIEKIRKSKIFMLSSSENPNDLARAKNNRLVIDYLLKPINLVTVQKIFQ